MKLTKEIKRFGNSITEEDAYVTLFYTLISHNSYYEDIVEYASGTENGIDGVVEDIAREYLNFTDVTPYTFCDLITDEILAGNGVGKTISEILDGISVRA